MRTAYLPRKISLYITNRCQWRCQHCFLVQARRIGVGELALQQVLAILDEAMARKVFMVIIAGGEPLLHPQIFDIIKAVKARNMQPLLGITGTGITDNIARQLRDSGIRIVQISLDSHQAATHDSLRGQGSFQDTLHGVAILRRHGIEVNASVCVHKGNHTELDSILRFLQSLQVGRVKLSFYEAFTPSNGFLDLTSEEKQIALSQVHDFEREAGLEGFVAVASPGSTPKIKAMRHPPLVVNAEGTVSVGEGGPIIGTVGELPIADMYSAHVTRRIRHLLDRLLMGLQRTFGIADLQFSEKLKVDGITYYYEGFHILINSTLCESLRYFTILHEIGHVATNTLRLHPHRQHDAAVELQADVWALDQLAGRMDAVRLELYKGEAARNRKAFLRLISERLFDDISNLEEAEPCLN